MNRSPQLENGYIRYAHELDAALAYADFTKGARIVLREVFAQVFGPADRKVAKLSPTELGKVFEINKGFFGRAIRELLDAGAIAKAGECRYTFVKDYSKWTKNGRPRLSEVELKLAARATERALMYKHLWVVNPVNTGKEIQQTLILDDAAELTPSAGCNRVNEPTPKGAIQATDRCQSSKQSVVNPVNGAPYMDRAREEENGERRIHPPKPPGGGKSGSSDFILPDWVPADDWADFVAMRKSLRKSLTDPAKRLAVKKLAKLKKAGHDPADVLQQSVFHGWLGLFPVREDDDRRAARRLPEPPTPKLVKAGDPLT